MSMWLNKLDKSHYLPRNTDHFLYLEDGYISMTYSTYYNVSFWDQLQKAVGPKNRHPPPLHPPATAPLTHTMTSLPHPADTGQQLPIFSPKMHFADLPYKAACLYQVSTTKPLFLPPFLSLLFTFFTFHLCPSMSTGTFSSVYISCVRHTCGQSGFSRTEQTVTESVSGHLCCSWLVAGLSPLFCFF